MPWRLWSSRSAAACFEVALFALAAVGLDGAELVERFVELAGEAVALDTDGLEETMGVEDSEAVLAGEEAGFEERDAVEAPGGVGEFADELGFGGRGGLVFIAELAAVVFVGGGVFGGEDGGAGGESMGEGVEGGAVFAGVGAGAGGVLRVGAVGGGARGGDLLSCGCETGLHLELSFRIGHSMGGDAW